MKKILCVDDDNDILNCFRSTLTMKGYEVFTTSDPKQVAELLGDHEVDLLMLDVCMPEKDGFMVFREMKKKNPKLPVLFVTAYPKSFTMKSDDVVQMWMRDFADGNTDILYKPFSVDILYEKIESLIGKAEGS